MTRQLPFLATIILLGFTSLNLHASHPKYRAGGLANTSAPTTASVACTELYNDGFESSFGIWIDGGSNCALSTSFPNSGTGSVELRAGVGITSSMYTPALDFTGVGVNLSFSFYPQGYETGEGLVLEYATNANGTYTGFAAWVRGTHFENNTRYNVTIPMNSVAWTSNSRLRLRSVASATDDRVYIDDVVISNCCEVGASCNDNNQCTINDVINANCQCVGTYQDSDNDGTCDAFDICPGVDDYLIISEAPCDDGDPCTTGDHMDSDICGCQGQYIDWDNDGYCASEDPDDLDACNPDPMHPSCNPCTTHDYEHFESNFGDWNSGGNDCSRVYAPQYANAGNYCVRLQDNTGSASSMFTDNINLAGLNNVSVSFSFIAVSMEVNEDFFLEVSTNGGSSYTVYESWSRGVDFQNNTRVNVSVPVTGITWTNQTRFRIRCDASANDDRVYIDDVTINSCLNYPALQAPVVIVQPEISNDVPGFFTDPEDVILSPNPTSTELRLSGILMEEATIEIFNPSGTLMRSVPWNGNTLDVSQLNPGLYFVRIEKDDQLIVRKFIKD